MRCRKMRALHLLLLGTLLVLAGLLWPAGLTARHEPPPLPTQPSGFEQAPPSATPGSVQGLFDEYIELSGGAPQQRLNQPLAPPSPNRLPYGVERIIDSSLMAYHYLTEQLSGAYPTSPEFNPNTPELLVYDSLAWPALGSRFGWSLSDGPLPPYPSPVVTVLPASDPSVSASVREVSCPDLFGPVYLIRSAANPSDPARIIGQGTLWPNLSLPPLRFWGVSPTSTDRAVAIVQNPHTGERLVVPQQYLLQLKIPGSVGPAHSGGLAPTAEALPAGENIFGPVYLLQPQPPGSHEPAHSGGLDPTAQAVLGAEAIRSGLRPTGSLMVSYGVAQQPPRLNTRDMAQGGRTRSVQHWRPGCYRPGASGTSPDNGEDQGKANSALGPP